MLRHRLTLGPILIAIVIGVIWLDEWLEAQSGYASLIIFPCVLGAALAAVQEIAPIFRALNTRASRRVLSAAATLGLCAAALTPHEIAGISGVAIVCSAAVVILIGSIVIYSRQQTTAGVTAGASAALFVFVYLGLLGGFLVVLRNAYSAWVLLGVVLVTKSCDIGAYFTGRAIGRHKLIPWLSPGKTWEGLVGGVALSTGVGVAALATGHAADQLTELSLMSGALIGGVLGVVGQGGDLVASVLKRDAGVKDYSSVLPGFGGVMDVLDSALLTAPVAYWMLIALT